MNQAFTLLLVCLLALSCSLLAGFFISTAMALRKFAGLDKGIQSNLGRLEYYMAVVRRLPKEELLNAGALSDDEIRYCNSIEDIDQRVNMVRSLAKLRPITGMYFSYNKKS